jgi:hypothetical protein
MQGFLCFCRLYSFVDNAGGQVHLPLGKRGRFSEFVHVKRRGMASYRPQWTVLYSGWWHVPRRGKPSMCATPRSPIEQK